MGTQPHADERNYLTISELSAKTGFSVTQLRRLARAKKIPSFQPAGKGGKLKFPPDAIERIRNSASTEAAEPEKPLSGRRPNWMED